MPNEIDLTNYPTLAKLIADGIAFFDGDVIVGTAGDGAEVQIGDVHSLAETEAFVRAFTPAQW